MTLAIRASDPQIRAAVRELKRLLSEQYPDASFSVGYGEDPARIYLQVFVDETDTDAMLAPVLDKLYELEVERRLPIYVQPDLPRPDHWACSEIDFGTVLHGR